MTLAATGLASDAYRLLVYGTGENDEPFCCLVDDQNNTLASVTIKGTEHGDVLRNELTVPWNEGAGRVLELRGNSGPDFVYGGSANGPGLTTVLRGGRDPDWLIGGSAPEVLIGGRHADMTLGGDGNDVCVNDYDVDWMNGQGGTDWLCAAHRDSTLVGGSTVEFANTLWFEPGMAGPPTSTQNNAMAVFGMCGHSSYGSGWAQCTSFNLSARPAQCQGYMP
jgi:Ca2+-binding RTX toxin-like protein